MWWFAELGLLDGFGGQWPMIAEAACGSAWSLRRRVAWLVSRILKFRVPVIVGGIVAVIVDRTAVFYWMLLSMLRESSLSAESAGL